MRDEIISNLHNPQQLEKLYREHGTVFTKNFKLLYPDIQDQATAQVWNARLNFEQEEISWGTSRELIFIIIASCIAGFLAKIPAFTSIGEEFYYTRNIGFIIFPILIAYFAWKRNISNNKLLLLATIALCAAFYINLLPNNSKSDTLILACIHLPLFLWTLLGFSFVSDNTTDYQKRLGFLRYNGDLVVMATIITIAGVILTGLTIGLFSLIDVNIEEFYVQYIAIWGLASVPIVGTYLVQTNPQLVNKVSPIIAKVFTPLVFVTLVIYLFTVIQTGKDPYNDRNFLIMFNMLLIGVMAIILFSVAETAKNSSSKFEIMLLLGLSIVTIVLNGIALSAILFRISEWGITPNRLAVLGGNILILSNLLIVTFRLFKTVQGKGEIAQVEKSIARFLPIYSLWTILVVFVFPLIFNFK